MRLGGVDERLRLMQVYGQLTRYGVDIAFDRSPFGGVRRAMQQWIWRPPVPVEPLPTQVKVRLLLQDLGPTYVKLGQIISSQGRALPSEWEEELAKLQSDVRPFPYEQVREIVTDALGAPPEELYESFDPSPLAAASLAQVHRATLQDGRPVAVKVQRPDIHEQLRSDVRILMRAAAVLERRAAWAEDVDLVGVIREFGTTLLRELDYGIEAYNARRLARVLEPIEGLHVPDVTASLSADRVLTLEFIEGVKPTDTAAIDAAGLDREELARTLVRGAVKMLLIDGFFHGDPHPGNVVVETATGRMTLLDTGMVGELDLRKRLSLGSLLVVSRNKDVDGLAQTLRSLSTPFRETSDRAYFKQFAQQIGPLMDTPEGDPVPLQKVIPEAMDVLRDNGYRLDAQLTLAIKAMTQAEAITAALVPEARGADFAEAGVEAIEELLPQAVTKDKVREAVRKQAMFAAREAAQHVPSLRQAAFKWIDQFEKGQVSVKLDLSDLDRQVKRFDSIARLLAVAIVLTGMTIGSALAAAIGTNDDENLLSALTDAALVLYVVSVGLGVVLVLVLLWRIARPEGRRRRRGDLDL
jgi:ubiquinone biosynthesis protein